MHPILFVPEGRTRNGDRPEAILDAVGCPDWILGAQAEPVERGPDGGPGTLFRWDRSPLDIASAEWVKAHKDPRQGLPAGRYHIGFAKTGDARPCHPTELERPYAFGGRSVVLGDRQGWMIPTAVDLGFEAKFADDGSWRFVLQRQYHKFGLEVARWRQKVADESIVTATAEQVFRFVLSALRLNYRLTDEVVDRLRLFDQINLKDAWFAAVGEKAR